MNKIILAAVACIGLSATYLKATPFPANEMKWTSDDKNQQRQAGNSLSQKLYAAAKSGEKSFNIPKGIYRFNETAMPKQPYHIELRGVKNFTIEGNNSLFIFERQASYLRLIKCDNLTIKNLQLDSDPLPYTQGTVISINEKDRTIEYKPDPGFPFPELMVKQNLSWNKFARINKRVLIWDRKTGLIKPDQLGMDISSAKDAVTKLPNGNYRVKVAVWWGKTLKNAQFEIGDAVTMWARAGRGIRIEVCGKIVLDNVDIYSAGFVAYAGHLGQGPFIIRNCDIKIRPGTTRLMSGNADGYNIRGTYHGAVIENCKSEAIGDDHVNLQGVYFKVFETVSPTELIVAVTPENEGANPVWHFLSGTPWNDKEQPQMKDLKSWAYLGKAKVLSKQPLIYTIPAKRKIHEWAAAGRYAPGKKYPALRVKLDKPVPTDANTVFWSENAILKGSVIRNNVFYNNLARGIRLQTIGATVENNKISYTTAQAMSLSGHPGFWGEATNSQDVIIRNNTFKDSGRCGGNAAVEMVVEGNPEVTEPIKNIIFENNRIINPRGSGIELVGCENVQIINNVITGLKTRPYRDRYNRYLPKINLANYGIPIVKGRGLKNIVIKDNKID